MRNNHGKALRRLLAPAAEALEVDYDLHTLFMYGGLHELPGGRREDVAFGLLAAGGTLLAAKTYADEFPAEGRTARKGAKLLAAALDKPQSLEGAAMLARAQALLAARRQLGAGRPEEATTHHASADLLQEAFPIPADAIDDVDHYLAKSFERAEEAMAALEFQQWTTICALTRALGPEFMEGKAVGKLVLPGTGLDALVTGHADGASRWVGADERRMLYLEEAVARGLL